MIHSLLTKLFNRYPGKPLLAKLADMHDGRYSAHRRKDKEERESAEVIAAHKLKIIKHELAIIFLKEAIRLEEQRQEMRQMSRIKQLQTLHTEEIDLLVEMHKPPDDREERENARLLELETLALRN